MNAKTFVDTNVLVYAYDERQDASKKTAQTILLDLRQERSGALSMQVLQEFYNTVTRKLRHSASEGQGSIDC